MSITKRKIKSVSVNSQTGEMHETLTTQTQYNYRRPVNGYKGAYMESVLSIIERSKTAGRLFRAIVKNVDEYNIIVCKWNSLIPEDATNISKAKKELVEHGFIAKIGKSWVLNPFMVLPKYQTQAPENQSAVQQIWKRYVENMNDWYDGIDEDAKEIYGV